MIRRRRTRLGRDEAVSSVVGTILTIGIVIVLSIGLAFTARQWQRHQPPPIESGAKATFTDDGYWVEPTGPDPIPLAGARMNLVVDGNRTLLPLTSIPMLSGLTSWGPGLRVCIMGADPACYLHQGSNITLDVYTAHNYVFTVRPLRASGLLFTITNGVGGILTHGTRDVQVTALGSQYSCGSTMPVTGRVTTDGGLTWLTLFGGAAITPGGSGQTYDAGAVPTNHVVGVESKGFGAACGIADATVDSVSNDPQALILKAGDPAPNYAPYQGQAPLASFLVPYVNTQTQTMVLAPNQIIIFFDLCCYPSSAVDYQDAVFLLTFS